MKTFNTLELAIEFYGEVEDSSIKGNLREQLLRAASSIALNLSEGNAKPSAKEKRRFYQIAYASQKECQAILRLVRFHESALWQLLDSLGAHIYRLMQSPIKVIQKLE